MDRIVMMPICKFADVSEHDMHMLFLEKFVVSKDFLNIFTSKINIHNATVVEIEHSKTHSESQVIENKAVTEFWSNYISYKKKKLTTTEGTKGSKVLWPQFNTFIEKIKN